MRRPRVLAEAGRPGLYHVCSRVVDRRAVFFERERERFVWLLKNCAAFAGVDVVSWCVMGNHFHILVRVPVFDADALDDDEVLARMEPIYSGPRMRHFREVWERCGGEEARRAFLAPFRARMGNLSDFVRTVKQRFTVWFNRQTDREGTLWEGRFRSVLVEHNESDDGRGLGVLARFVAGYIDLNPVRAGVVQSARDCDWSGYGAALRGDEEGERGMRLLWGEVETKGMSRDSLFARHQRMLDQRRLARIGVPDAEGSGNAEAGVVGRLVSGESGEGVHSGGAISGEGGGHSREELAGIGGMRPEPGASGSFSPEIERSAEMESKLLARMGERCIGLTRGRVVDSSWLVQFPG